MEKSERFLLLGLFLLSLIVIFFSQSRAILFFKNNASGALKPLEIILSGGKNWLTFWQGAIFNIKSLKESNAQLVLENLELYGKIAKLSEIENENLILKEKLNLKNDSIDTVWARVVGRDFQNNRVFTVDRGTDDGIRNGMAVSLAGGILLGAISDAGPKLSKVQTVFDTQSRISAVTGKTRISGLARGLGLDVIFDLIAKKEIPEEGELVISSGTDGIFPRGFIIGKVKNAKTADSQVFNTADIEIIANISDSNDVLIITNK